MEEEERVLESIKDEGFDLISRNATKKELCNFFDVSSKKLTKPNLIKKFEEYKTILKEMDEILHWKLSRLIYITDKPSFFILIKPSFIKLYWLFLHLVILC